ncbi:MAG: hypothetical protein ABI665_01310 [Vicinamibacterales bacterium]
MAQELAPFPDPPEPDELELAERPQPPWQDDLESLFQVVDSRIIERRAATSPPADGHQASRESAPPPAGSWVGFGLEDAASAAGENNHAPAVEQLAAQVLAQVRATLLDGDLTAAIRHAAREAVESALKERLGDEVRAGVEAALREVSARGPADITERPLASSTIVSIRLRPRRPRQSGAGLLTLKTR